MKLEILTVNPRYLSICKDYWATDHDEISGMDFYHFTIKEIREKYNLTPLEVTNIIHTHCHAHSDNTACLSCAAPYVFTSRSDHRSKKNYDIKNQEWVCRQCAKEASESAQEAKDANISAFLDSFTPSDFDVQSAPLIERLTLYAILTSFRASRNQTYTYTPLRKPIAPDLPSALSTLLNSGYLDIQSVNPHAFSFLEDDSLVVDTNLFSFTFKVRYPEGNGCHKKLKSALRQRFKYDDINDPQQHDAILDLLRHLLIQESVRFYTMLTTESNFVTTDDARVVELFTQMTERYSTAQIRKFIWLATQDAIEVRGQAPFTVHIEDNAVLSFIIEDFERSLEDPLTVEPLSLDSHSPLSVCTELLLSQIVADEDGYHTIYTSNANLTHF